MPAPRLNADRGAVEPAHLPACLGEFVFRFNRRTSRNRGTLVRPAAHRAWPARSELAPAKWRARRALSRRSVMRLRCTRAGIPSVQSLYLSIYRGSARCASSPTSSGSRSRGSTGTTSGACTAPSATSRPRSSRSLTTLTSKHQPTRRWHPHRSGREPETVQVDPSKESCLRTSRGESRDGSGYPRGPC